jgi:mannose-6-phosphate isomerase-like protein (cupin superfamily)
MAMIRAGFADTDPRTNTRTVVIAGAEETAGRGWVLEVHCPEGAPSSILPHLHERWTETFEIVQGSASCRLAGEVRALRAGDRLVFPAGVPHEHPWNTGAGTMVYRQSNDFGACTPEAVAEVLGAFASVNDLARAGRVGADGRPRNPLQLAATLRALGRHGGYDAAVPVAVQKLVAATLGRVAEALGYRGVAAKYLG